MTGENIDRRDFADFVVGNHMHNGEAFGRAAQPSTFIQRMVFVFAGTRWLATSFFRCVLNGWRKKASTFVG
ncbi:hypothetical protein GGC47_004471 [Bosea sp. OAE752]|uniref:hypothetical protein n=1 Tax=Bosea sp. OAE752 TaxID=2663873 RepID=UPI003D1EF2AC